MEFFFLAVFTQPKKKTPTHIFFWTCQFTQTEKKYTQPKRIYSANGNPFIPMIYRFYAPLLFPDLCATLINNITLFFGNLSPWEGNKRSVFLAGVHLILLCFIRISLLSAETFFSFNKNLFPMHFNLSDRGDLFFFINWNFLKKN